MSAQVSYKKQFAFFFLLVVIYLVIIEALVNVWWYNFYTCEFEDNELFENLDDKTKKELCLENLEIQHTDTKISPHQGQFLSINSHGFRGQEITLEKPENTYRIIALGGSTVFGTGVKDNESFPAVLQEKFDNVGLNYKVQVINAGIPGMGSEAELNLIKSRLVNYNPDLFIKYNGINELGKKVDAVTWRERVIEGCKFANNLDIETLVILQPLITTANRDLTEQELKIYQKGNIANFVKPYPAFAEQLPHLKSHCIKVVDMRGMFDNILEPVFWDVAHVNAKGNRIVAESLYKETIPIVLENAQKPSISSDEYQTTNTDLLDGNSKTILEDTYGLFEKIILSYKTPRVISYSLSGFDSPFTGRGDFFDNNIRTDTDSDLIRTNLIGANFTGKDFSGQNLENAVFFGADLSNANFENSNLQGADFSSANVNGINFAGANLQGANLSETDLSWLNLSHLNLVNANLNHTKLVGTNLTEANLMGATITYSDLSVANLQLANLNGANLSYSDLSVVNLEGAKLVATKIVEGVMHAVNLVDADLTDAKIINSDLYSANLQNATLEGTDFTDSNLTCINHPICI